MAKQLVSHLGIEYYIETAQRLGFVQVEHNGIEFAADPVTGASITLPTAGLWVIEPKYSQSANLETNRTITVALDYTDDTNVVRDEFYGTAAAGLPSSTSLIIASASDRNFSTNLGHLLVETSGPVTVEYTFSSSGAETVTVNMLLIARQIA